MCDLVQIIKRADVRGSSMKGGRLQYPKISLEFKAHRLRAEIFKTYLQEHCLNLIEFGLKKKMTTNYKIISRR